MLRALSALVGAFSDACNVFLSALRSLFPGMVIGVAVAALLALWILPRVEVLRVFPFMTVVVEVLDRVVSRFCTTAVAPPCGAPSSWGNYSPPSSRGSSPAGGRPRDPVFLSALRSLFPRVFIGVAGVAFSPLCIMPRAEALRVFPFMTGVVEVVDRVVSRSLSTAMATLPRVAAVPRRPPRIFHRLEPCLRVSQA